MMYSRSISSSVLLGESLIAPLSVRQEVFADAQHRSLRIDNGSFDHIGEFRARFPARVLTQAPQRCRRNRRDRFSELLREHA